MTAFLAAGLVAAAVLVATSPRSTATRLARVIEGSRSPAVAPQPRRVGTDNGLASGRARAVAAMVAGTTGWLFVGGGTGVVFGVAAAVGTSLLLGRLEPAAVVRDRERSAALLPLAADLLAAAMTAGSPPDQAARAVGDAIGGPLGSAVVKQGALLQHGSDLEAAADQSVTDPSVRSLVRALTRATARGVSPVPVLERVATDARDAARWAGEARARSLGARAAAPLGLCFLPAFVLVGVVPVVVTAGPLLP